MCTSSILMAKGNLRSNFSENFCWDRLWPMPLAHTILTFSNRRLVEKKIKPVSAIVAVQTPTRRLINHLIPNKRGKKSLTNGPYSTLASRNFQDLPLPYRAHLHSPTCGGHLYGLEGASVHRGFAASGQPGLPFLKSQPPWVAGLGDGPVSIFQHWAL